eukprot:scaffold7346_cov245-Pinguiococcus_pyrenoidosus.AAC.32
MLMLSRFLVSSGVTRARRRRKLVPPEVPGGAAPSPSFTAGLNASAEPIEFRRSSKALWLFQQAARSR